MATALPEITRTISGKGVIILSEDYFSSLQVVLYAQILRKPRNRSANLTWNPDKSFYAHITFCFDDYVLYEYDMNFDSQMWVVHDGQNAQNLLSLICAYDGILDSFVSVGNVIGVTLSRTNLIKSHPYLRFVPNRIRFECFADSAVTLTLKGTALDKCDPQDGDNTPPPPPPPPVTPVPPGTPVPVSPPFEGEDDGGDTVPFPIDEPDPNEDFPQGDRCLAYVVRVNYDFLSGQNFDDENSFWGEILGIRTTSDPVTGSAIEVDCYGLTSTLCAERGWYRLTGTGNENAYFNLTLISVTLIP